MWCVAFGIGGDDHLLLYKCMRDLWVLIGRCKSEVLAVQDINHELYLESFVAIEEIAAQGNLDSNSNQIRKKLAEKATLQGLRFCADAIDQRFGEVDLSQQEISDLLADVNVLIETVLHAEHIPGVLQRELALQLEGVRYAIMTYRLNGTEGIAGSMNQIYGTLVRHESEYEDLKSGSPTVAEQLDNVMNKAEKAIAKGERVKSLLGRAGRLLPWVADKAIGP